MEELKLTPVQHLAELRNRVAIIFGAILVGSIVSYSFVNPIIELISQPAKELRFVYLTPPELFLACLKLSLAIGIAAASPIILLQIWLFVKPALTKSEKNALAVSLFSGIFFFAAGVGFAYKVILPLTINFFVSITVPGIEPMFSFGDYVGFVSSIMLSFGAVFELPMLVVALTRFGLIRPVTLQKYRKFAILIIFIVAAVLTPPDVISQLLLAAPMLLLYELSIILSKAIVRKKNK